jgi:hypothetical protein
MDKTCIMHTEMRNKYKVLMGRPKLKKSLSGDRNISWQMWSEACEGVECIQLAHDRVHSRAYVNSVMKV